MGGTSAERSISLKTGKAIYASLKRQGFHVTAIDAAMPLPEALKKNKINFAYIALHGPGGEDGSVQGLLEWLKIPYTGSGVLSSAMAMDKVASKRLFDAAKLPTAPWYSLTTPSRFGNGHAPADVRLRSRVVWPAPTVIPWSSNPPTRDRRSAFR